MATVRAPAAFAGAALALLLLLMTASAALVTAAPPAAGEPDPTPGLQPCEQQQHPPPLEDEADQEEEDGLGALPLPEEPIGGERLGDCETILPAQAPAPPEEVTAVAWMVSDLDTGEVLAAQDPHGRYRPASLIKVLLAAAVAEELDVGATVEATEDGADQACTCAGLVEGEPYGIGDLLTATLIHSGNDAAYTLGEAFGSLADGLGAMNSLAGQLRAHDTRAATTSGLDAPGMSSSAYDMTLILRHALSQPAIVEAMRTTSMDFPVEDGEDPVTLLNDNQLLADFEGFIGGKTGFTNAARHTYMGAAERNGTPVGIVLLGTEREPEPVPDQSAALLDYGFELAAEDHEPVGELVAPHDGEGDEPDLPDTDLALGQDGRSPAAGDPTAGEDEGAGGVGPVVAVVIAALALLAALALGTSSTRAGR